MNLEEERKAFDERFGIDDAKYQYSDLYHNAFDFKVIGLDIGGKLFNMMFMVDSCKEDRPFQGDDIYITMVRVGQCVDSNFDNWSRTEDALELEQDIQRCMHIGYQLLNIIRAQEQSNEL